MLAKYLCNTNHNSRPSARFLFLLPHFSFFNEAKMLDIKPYNLYKIIKTVIENTLNSPTAMKLEN